MPLPATRSLYLSDLIVLLGATAVGLAALRFFAGDLEELRRELSESWNTLDLSADSKRSLGRGVATCFALVMTVLVPICWAWTLAMVPLFLRPPRAPLCRLACLPGAIACFSASCALVLPLFGLLYLAIAGAGALPTTNYESVEFRRVIALVFLAVPALAGFAVAGAWLAIVLGRRYEPEPSWLDRVGRVLGAYWIGSIFLVFWAFT
jgi:hypothetical protein